MQAAANQSAMTKADTAFIRKTMAAPLLEREEEAELARAWREDGDERALHRLVDSHMRLVAAIASRFRAYGLSMPDMVQEGSLGLLQAANRFETDRGVRFSTYASWWVRSAIQDYILRNWSIVRSGTTSSQKSLFFNLRRLRQQIERASGRELDSEGREKIAKALKVSRLDVEMMEGRIGGPDQSLNATLTDDSDLERMDLVRDDRPGPEDLIIGVRDSATRSRWLRECLAELSQRERIIIEQRRLQEAGRTLEDLGKVLGVSKERVRQLESRALKKLRVALSKRVEQDSDLLLEE